MKPNTLPISTGSASFTQVHIVYVNDFAYCDAAGDTTCPNPYVIAIDPGEHMVVRDGEPGAAHSVTECANSNFTICGGAGLFDSGIQDPAVGEDYVGAVTIDLRNLDRVLEVDAVSRAARIQAGASGPPPWG